MLSLLCCVVYFQYKNLSFLYMKPVFKGRADTYVALGHSTSLDDSVAMSDNSVTYKSAQRR